MTLHPLRNYILCSVHEGRDLPEGFTLPDGVELQPFAKVIACGPECKLHKLGDMVLFNPSNAIFADTIDDQKCVIVPETCTFACYTKDDTEGFSKS